MKFCFLMKEFSIPIIDFTVDKEMDMPDLNLVCLQFSVCLYLKCVENKITQPHPEPKRGDFALACQNFRQ